MSVSLKYKIGSLVFDIPRFVWLWIASRVLGREHWKQFRNRNEQISLSSLDDGVKCEWQWTSDLHLPKVFPFYGRKLLQLGLHAHPIEFYEQLNPLANCAEICFIIGHRGDERLPLLLCTLNSIAAQKHVQVSCIVVEQAERPTIADKLPSWVIHLHQFVESNAPYSRSSAFNFGVSHCTTPYVILHDNDMLVPKEYAFQHLCWFRQGYDVVNLKRFIFYLSEGSTRRLCKTGKLTTSKVHIEAIVQNLEGGGSIGISRSAYWNIGGFDEQFAGWGGEDNEFWDRAVTARVWDFTSSILVHLWHEPQAEKTPNKQTANTSLYQKLSTIPVQDRIQTLRKSLDRELLDD